MRHVLHGVGWTTLLAALVGCNTGLTSWTGIDSDPVVEDVPEEELEEEEELEPEEEETDISDPPEDTGTTDPPEPELSDFERCFEEIMGDGSTPGPDYDQFEPVIGSHCSGTNHQTITGVERVVFLGDSVTVGTPPSKDSELYRNILADDLASHFGLSQPGFLWKAVNVFDGTSAQQQSGDFASCAKWGARTDDLMQDNSQVTTCMPDSERNKKTLVVMTMGGNDLANLTEGFIEGKSTTELWTQTREYMQLMRDTATWIKEPGRFPNGVYLVFTNLYEYTDATGDTGSCPAAGLAGFGDAVTDPALEEMVIWSMEEFMSIAVDTGSDMLFLLESFCGHGFNYDDPSGRCYRGADAELWFDLTCTHPNPTGHAVIADMFMNVVRE